MYTPEAEYATYEDTSTLRLLSPANELEEDAEGELLLTPDEEDEIEEDDEKNEE